MVLNAELRRFRIAALVEGTSLLALLLTMIWRLRFGGPDLAATMGPLHGIAFTAYVVTALQARPAARWAPWQTALLVLAAVVPFGGHLVASRLGGRTLL